MKKIFENCWVKLILFFTIGMSLMTMFDIIVSVVDEQKIKESIGRYNYYIIKYIVLTILGTMVFIVLSKFIRGKDSSIMKVVKSEKQRIELGMLIGLMPAVMLGASFLILTKVGWIEIQGQSGFFSLKGGLSIALNVMSTAVFEELGFRSFIFGLIKEKHSSTKGVLITSFLFALIHIGSNLSIVCYINLFLLSVFFIEINMVSNTILASIIAHFVWNFVHSVLLSLKMYGAEYYPHLLDINVSGNEYLSGGLLGLENSLIVTVALCVVIIGFYKLMRRGEIRYED